MNVPRKAGWIPGGFAPSYLDGSLPGDVGFDPLALVMLAPVGTSSASGPFRNAERKTQLLMLSSYEQKRKVAWMREAEIKHSRLAMMAAAGWPISELIDGPLSRLFGLPSPLDATGGRAPSLFNGGLFEGPQGVFVGLVTLATAALECARARAPPSGQRHAAQHACAPHKCRAADARASHCLVRTQAAHAR